MSEDTTYEQNSLDRFTHEHYVPKLRRCLLNICEGDPCKAMLLDLFYVATQEHRDFLESERYKEYVKEYPHEDAVERWTGHTLGEFSIIFSDLFDKNQIYDAILFFAKKGWVDFQLESVRGYDHVISFYAHIDVIDQALEKRLEKSYQLREEILEEIRKEQAAQREADEKRAWQIRKEERAINQAIVDERRSRQIRKEAEEQVQRDRREARKIAHHIGQDKVRGLIGTLTLTQWLETLDYFHWKCAYCPDGPYEVLEHFVPVTLNGKTDQDNCVPACISCNRKKNNKHPSSLHREMGDCIEQVQLYLSQARFEHGEKG